MALAAAGVRVLDAGDVTRETEQPAAEPGPEATQRSFECKADLGLGVFAGAVSLG